MARFMETPAWLVVAVGDVWGSLYLIRSHGFVPGSLLLLVSLVLLWGSSKTLCRNRQPFVFAVRGDRKVKFRGSGQVRGEVQINLEGLPSD
jgi:hypothetical protein